MDNSLLQHLDLNASELALYQAILKAGSLSPVLLAKAAGLKRTTAYSVARSLVEKGLVVEDSTKRPRVIVPANAEQVLDIIEKDKKQLAIKESSLKRLAGELSKLSAGNEYSVPTVRFVEENKIESFLKQNAPLWDDTAVASGECTWWGFQDHTFVEYFNKWIEWYWKRGNERTNLNLLTNRATAEVEFAKKNAGLERRNIKFWNDAEKFHSSTWIVGDFVIMINTQSHPFYLVEIHDKLMAHDQREVFKSLWDKI